MALIIKAQMPKGCEWTDKASRTGMGYCPPKDKCMAYREELSKQYTINAHPIDFIPADCPIIGEIPDKHGRLIVADALLEKLEKIALPDDLTYTIAHGILKQIIEDAPTIVEANNE